MKRLLLLRHAKAVQANEPLADFARPLAERGERDARRIGQRLLEHRLAPNLLLASPAARALHTAQLVAEAIGYPFDAIALDRGLYLAEPAGIVRIVETQSTAVETLLVVGHNPGLTELVHHLLPSFDVDDLPTSAVVGLEYTAAAWVGIERAAAALCYYDFPKNQRAPVTRR